MCVGGRSSELLTSTEAERRDEHGFGVFGSGLLSEISGWRVGEEVRMERRRNEPRSQRAGLNVSN